MGTSSPHHTPPRSLKAPGSPQPKPGPAEGPRLGVRPELCQRGEAGLGRPRDTEGGGSAQEGQGVLCPRKDLFSRLSLDQSKERLSLTLTGYPPLWSPQSPPPAVAQGKRPPHLRMYIEVFIGFKALFFTLRVVKKKALFDDEKPIVGGGEGGATRREG